MSSGFSGWFKKPVLQLTSDMFMKKKYPVVVVQAMPVLKRYEKLSVYQDEDKKTRFVTEKRKAFRTFPIRVDDKNELNDQVDIVEK